MKSRFPRRHGAALVITLSMIAMMTFLVVAFFARSLNNLQVETASTGTIRADLLARNAGGIIVSDFRTEIIAGSTASGSGAQAPVYVPKSANAMIPAISRAAGTSAGAPEPFVNLVKQSTGRFFPDAAPYVPASGTKILPIIQTVTNVPSDMISPNGRTVVNYRWDVGPGAYLPGNTYSSYPSGLGPQLVLNSPPITYSHYYSSSLLPHWIMMTRDGVPAVQDAATVPTAWKDYSPTGTSAAIGRFAYNIYNVGGLLDVNAAGYDEAGGTVPPITVGQKGTPGLAQLSVIPGIASDANASLFAKNWRNLASGTSADNYLAYLGYSKNATNVLLTGNPFFSKGSLTGFLTAASGTTSSDNRVLGRQDLIRMAVKSGSPYGVNATSLPYLTHFSREVNAPSWYPSKDAGGTGGLGGNSGTGSPAPYAYTTNKDNPLVANRFFPNVRVGPNPNPGGWRRLTGELAVEGEPLIKYRFPLSWLVVLQDLTPATASWDLTPEATAIVTALDLRNKANGGPGLSGQTTNDRAADLVQRAFGLVWDTANSRWKYVGSSTTVNAATAPASSIELLGEPSSSAAVVCKENREPNFFELLKAGILSGSLGNSSDYESLCVSTGEDGNADYHVMQIGANIIDQADTDSYPTQIAFGVKYDNPPRIKESKTASGNAPPAISTVAVDPKVFSGVEDLPYIYTILSTPYRIPAGQDDLNQSLPSPDPNPPFAKVQNAKRDMLDAWLQFVMWKPQQPPVGGAPTTSGLKFRIVYEGVGGTFLRLLYFKGDGTFRGVDFSNGTYTAPVLSSATVNFDDSTDFRAPTLLGGMGATNLHNFSVSQPGAPYQGSGSTGGSTPVPLPRGMWIGEMYRPEKDSSDPAYANAPDINHLEFRATDNIKIVLQFQDGTGNWRTYQRYDRFAVGTGTLTNYGGRPLFGYADNTTTLKNAIGGDWGSPSYYKRLDVSTIAISAVDPRSHRYGLLAHYRDFSNSTQPPSTVPNVTWTNYLKQGWAPKSVTPYMMCFGPSNPARFFPSWTGGVQDNPWQTHTTTNCITDPTSFWVDNNTQAASSQASPSVPHYYLDMDGVQRRGDGDSTPVGTNPSNNVRPIQLVNSTPPTANTRDLGRILNRPFRSVGELGYVFRDEPYKSLNLFTDKSADSALLDLFTVNEQPAIVAGKVDLNTRNPEVIQALIVAAAREEQSTTNTITPADALNIATKLRDNIKDTTGNPNTGPLLNPAEIANRLVTILPVTSTDTTTTIKNQREVVGRALAGSGQTRTWNFLVDIIAQSGRYAPNATTPGQFIVDGEKRYWLHVAIDRYTGQVIDQQLESVLE